MTTANKPSKKPTNESLRALAKVSGMGLQMALVIYAGNLLGSYLDQKFELFYLEIVCTLVAIATAIYAMIKQAKKI